MQQPKQQQKTIFLLALWIMSWLVDEGSRSMMDLACHFVFSCGRDMGWEMIWEKTGIHKSFTINSSHATPLEDTFCPNLMMITMPLENILVQNSGKKGMLPLIEVCQFKSLSGIFWLLSYLNQFWKSRKSFHWRWFFQNLFPIASLLILIFEFVLVLKDSAVNMIQNLVKTPRQILRGM